MADVENVIKAWNCCNPFNRKCKECPYEKDCYHDGISRHMVADAIALLKEQEAVEPIPFHRSDGTIFKYECRKCRTKIFKMDLFCRHCGRSVKWN